MNCPTCGHNVYSPHRIVINGKIVEGCIDKIHDPVLVKPSTSWQWVTTCRKQNKPYCKEKCPYKPMNKKDYHCKNCNLV